jgi:hypothetical protein
LALLRFPKSEMNLGDRPGKDKRHCRRQTGNRQLQGGDEIDEFAQHRI